MKYKTVFNLLIMLFILSPLLRSADLNTTIVNGNAKIFNTLYQKLSDLKQSGDEINLQKALLTQLITLSQQKISNEQNLTTAEDQKHYLQLFDHFIQNIIEKEQRQKLVQRTSEKLKTLHRQIADQNTTSLTAQLFYALYNKEQKKAQARLTQLKKEEKKIQTLLIDALQHLTFDSRNLKKREQHLDNSLLDIKHSIQKLLLKKERYLLLDRTDMVHNIQQTRQQLQARQTKIARQKLQLLFLRFSIALQQKDHQAFALHKEILTYIQTHMSPNYDLNEDIDTLLTEMEKKILGTVAAIKGKGVQELHNQLQHLWSIANQPLFHINQTPVSIVKLLISLLIFIVGFLIGNLYKRQIQHLSRKNRTLTASTRTLLANLGYYLIFLITFFIVLKVLGIDLSSIALVAGALSVGIGFGLQNIISNFVSGIILMVERSIKIGDYIQLDNDIRGHVVDIKMRSITINTNSNIDVIVPNQDLIQNRVINWTMNDKIRRFEIPFGVAYGTDPQKVIDVVLEAVKNSKFNDIYTGSERYTRVVMTGMGNSSVDFELFVWINGREILYPKRTTSRFLILIYNALYANGIEIPFPQQDLHIRSVDSALPIVIQKPQTKE